MPELNVSQQCIVPTVRQTLFKTFEAGYNANFKSESASQVLRVPTLVHIYAYTSLGPFGFQNYAPNNAKVA